MVGVELVHLEDLVTLVLAAHLYHSCSTATRGQRKVEWQLSSTNVQEQKGTRWKVPEQKGTRWKIPEQKGTRWKIPEPGTSKADTAFQNKKFDQK